MASYSLGTTFDKKGNFIKYLYTDADFNIEDNYTLMALSSKAIEE